MNILKLFIITLLIAFSIGCANKKRAHDNLYRGLYEGLKARDRIMNRRPDAPLPDEQPMSYEQYKKAREKPQINSEE